MCTEAQPKSHHWGCYHSHWHLHSTNAQTLTLSSPKGVVRDNSCQTEVIRKPSVCHQSSKYRLLATICNDKLEIAMTLND